jgi:hypothetical protein
MTMHMEAVSVAADAAQRTQAFVVVHGIGEQIQFETVQSVVYEIGRLHEFPKAVAVGRFHTSPQPPYDPLPVTLTSSGPNLWFAEAYWADIPRGVVERKYVLEESKKWARTIAARVASASSSNAPRKHFTLLETVLDEMIETVFVLERLTFVLDRLGLLRINLKKLLVSFLGDVQVVTEFDRYRGEILSAFTGVLAQVRQKVGADADIHVVAHSEGTVVALFGLFEGMRDPKKHPWVEQVKGLMTIGSPLEVHFRLWDHLWVQYARASGPERANRIAWRNYLDFSDPIAYSLSTLAPWVQKNYGDWINFSLPAHEHAFSRYPFPGKAHVDYWHDERVFGHFIKNVVGGGVAAVMKKPSRYATPPRGYGWAWMVSYTMPYLLVLALIAAGVYALHRPVVDVLFGETSVRGSEIFKDVVQITSALAGITAATVLIRISTTVLPLLGAVAALVFGLLPALWEPSGGIQRIDEALATTGLPLTLPRVAGLVALVSGVFSRVFPKSRLRMLLGLGALATFSIVGRMLGWWPPGSSDELSTRELWPVVAGGLVFLYLWWLAAMVFELSFIWHRHVRHEIGLKGL